MAGGRTDGLIKNFRAGAAVLARRIVKFGASDVDVLQATGPGDASIGVALELDAALGKRLDVAMSDIAPVDYGGNVTRGDWLTSDAQGRAITAAPVAGVNAQVIGRAMVAGVLGDIGSVTGVNAQVIGRAMVAGVLGDIGSVHLRQGTLQG